MKPEQLVAVVIRLFAVFVFLKAIENTAQIYWFLGDERQEFNLYVTLSLSAVMVLIGTILWKFPSIIAGNITPVTKDTPHEDWTEDRYYSLGFVLLGTYILYRVISDASFWLFYLYGMKRDPLNGAQLTLENEALIAATVVEFFVALYLILCSRGITKLIMKLRYGE